MERWPTRGSGSRQQERSCLVEEGGVSFSSPATSPSDRSTVIFVLVEILAGAMSSILILVMTVGAASMVFHEGQLGAHRANGVAMGLLANLVGTLCHDIPVMLAQDVFMCTFFATMAANLLQSHPDMGAPFGTVAVAMGTASALQGVTFFLLGALRVGRAVQFVPTPVVSGYLSFCCPLASASAFICWRASPAGSSALSSCQRCSC
jgi:hypothetical protein